MGFAEKTRASSPRFVTLAVCAVLVLPVAVVPGNVSVLPETLENKMRPLPESGIYRFPDGSTVIPNGMLSVAGDGRLLNVNTEATPAVVILTMRLWPSSAM